MTEQNDIAKLRLMRQRTVEVDETRKYIAEMEQTSQDIYRKLTQGWSIVGDRGDYQQVIDAREKARHAADHHPFIIRMKAARLGWVHAKPPNLRSVTQNADLQEVVNEIVTDPMSTAFVDLTKNGEHEIVDGEMVVRLVMSEDGHTIMALDSDVDQFNPSLSIRNPLDGDSVWLHRRDYSVVESKEGVEEAVARVAYYPDAAFYPSEGLKAQLDERINGMKNENARIEWGIRVIRQVFNNGVPLALPAVDPARCLDMLIATDSSVRTAIAKMANYVQIEDVEEREQALEILHNSNVFLDDSEPEINTAVTSGSVKSVNVNIAMLPFDSALVRLLLLMIYNAAPGLRPQDWAESEPGGLGSGGSERNRGAIIAAELAQSVHGRFYKSIIEASLVMMIVLGKREIDGVSVDKRSFRIDNSTLLDSYRLVYDSSDDEIVIEWPNIDKNDTSETVDAFVKALTLDKSLTTPLGKPSDVYNVLRSVGIDIGTDETRDSWDGLDSNDELSTETARSIKSVMSMLSEAAERVDREASIIAENNNGK